MQKGDPGHSSNSTERFNHTDLLKRLETWSWHQMVGIWYFVGSTANAPSIYGSGSIQCCNVDRCGICKVIKTCAYLVMQNKVEPTLTLPLPTAGCLREEPANKINGHSHGWIRSSSRCSGMKVNWLTDSTEPFGSLIHCFLQNFQCLSDFAICGPHKIWWNAHLAFCLIQTQSVLRLRISTLLSGFSD